MNWLVGHLTVLGVEIQNWMLLAAFIFALWMFYMIAREHFAGSKSRNQE